MKHIRICSVLLALILAFSSLPLSVIAENTISFHDKNQVILDQNFTTETTDESDNVFIVQEDTTKRGEFEKHYICSDGTYVVASYAEAIHYKDDNGEWADVDNRPVQTAKGDYTTRNGDFGISVPSSTGDGHLMRMDKGEHSLSWTLSANKKAGTIKMDSNVSTMAQKPVQSQTMQVGTAKRPEIIVSNTEQPRENHKVLRDEATFDLPNVSGKVRYDDLFGAGEGVSVVYTTYRNKIEEDIYIEKPTDITSFSMEVEAPDLIPRLNADNSVDFLDNDGEMCYHVGIPYMMDADFAVLNDIETTVIRSGDTWIITYTPNAEWFTSEDRVYPILLDPSITTNEYRTNIQDTYVEDGNSTVHSSEQLLYINGGTGNRKAVIRFLTLPAIDDTMPLISANLTLYSQYSPFSDVSLKLSYTRDNVSTSISSYTYAVAANATSLYTSYGTLVTGSTSVTFNLTNCIYEMYESGRDDLILGYSNESDTTFCYPFHSVDTTTNYKPTLKVVYGYSLPETENSKLGNSKIIALRNVGTGAYMTANESLGSNVYQENVTSSNSNQWFRMKYMSETGGYRLHAIGSSSGKVVGIQPTNGMVYGTKNVALYTPDNPNTQEWLIVPVSVNQFRIVSRADMSKCLTAYSGNTGSATTTTVYTTGNVYATTVSEGNNYQIWYLSDKDDYEVYLELPPSSIDNGEYYIINFYTGRYLYKNQSGTNVRDKRGLLSTIGASNAGWRITNLGNGYCTIQTLSGMYYTYATDDNQVKISTLGDEIPDNYKWRITIADGGGVLIRNKYYNKYLFSEDMTAGQTSIVIKSSDDFTSDAYKQQAWRIYSIDEYSEFSINSGENAPCFEKLCLDINEPQKPKLLHGDNFSCADVQNFYYSTTNSEYFSIDNLNGMFTGTKIIDGDDITVTATHKTTGIQCEFPVHVNNNAIIIIPGIFGSELFLGETNVYFRKGAPIFSTEVLEMLAHFHANGVAVADITMTMIRNFLTPYTYNGDWILHGGVYASAFADGLYESLLCDSEGNSRYEVYTKKYKLELEDGDELETYTTNCGTLDMYGDLYDAIKETASSMYKTEFFSYDWRLSNAVSAEKLDAFINEAGYDKVILVAHSMGGLVASGYMAIGEEQTNRVKNVFYLASPLAGTPATIDVWYNQDFSFLPGSDAFWEMFDNLKFLLSVATLTSSPLQKLMSSYVSVYELLPNQHYLSLTDITYINTKVIVPVDNGSDEVEIGDTDILIEMVDTYTESTNILSNVLPYFNNALMTKAENFHDSCFSVDGHISNSTNAHYIYAEGMDTVIKFIYMYSEVDETYEPEFWLELPTDDGDSLVPKWSATLNSTINVYKIIGGHMDPIYLPQKLDEYIENIILP